jgi:hypothetical protein
VLDRASVASLQHGFRIVRVAWGARTIELVVESEDRHALARGMQGFEIRAARAFNRACTRRGSVFVDRYRATPLATAEARRAAIAAMPRRASHTARRGTGRPYSSSGLGITDSAPPPLRSASSAMRYSSLSHRPRSTS